MKTVGLRRLILWLFHSRLRSLEVVIWFMCMFVVVFMFYTLGQLHHHYARQREFTLSEDQQDGRRAVLSVQRYKRDEPDFDTVIQRKVQENSMRARAARIQHVLDASSREKTGGDLPRSKAELLDEIDGYNYFVIWETENTDDKDNFDNKDAYAIKPPKPKSYMDKTTYPPKQDHRGSVHMAHHKHKRTKGFVDYGPNYIKPDMPEQNSYNVLPNPKSPVLDNKAGEEEHKVQIVFDKVKQKSKTNHADNELIFQPNEYKGKVDPQKISHDAAASEFNNDAHQTIGGDTKNLRILPKGSKLLSSDKMLDIAKDDEANFNQDQTNHIIDFQPKQSSKSIQTQSKIQTGRSKDLVQNVLQELSQTGVKKAHSPSKTNSDLSQTGAKKAHSHSKTSPHRASDDAPARRYPTAERSKRRLYVDMIGRLGNNMFQFASAYAIARTLNRTLVMPGRSELYESYYDSVRQAVVFDEVPPNTTVKHEEKAGIFTSDLYYQPPRDVQVCCYLQSFRYFTTHAKEIRQLFEFKPSQRLHAEETLRTATRQYQGTNSNQAVPTLTYVGVHVRRGDLLEQSLVSRGYKPAPVTYLNRAMDYYRQKYPSVFFIVCSDEPEWVQSHIRSADVYLSRGGSNSMDDLAVLAACNHTVITVGTFGWWAGWLAGGEVVYYADWPTPGTEIGDSYNHQDYFMPHWKPFRG